MKYAQMHVDDNVLTALADFLPGDKVRSLNNEEVTIAEAIPFGHKIAIYQIGAGENIVKYGQVIGRACIPIPVGVLVHIHNVESLRGRGDLG